MRHRLLLGGVLFFSTISSYIAVTAPSFAQAPATQPAAVEGKLTVWDGETAKRGAGWVGPQAGTNTIVARGPDAHSGKKSVMLRGKGKEWIGGGWNWFGWYPDNAGTDITPYKNFSFWMKAVVEGDTTGAVNVGLNCSSTKKQSSQVDVAAYEPNALDGAWHEIIIPLADLYDDKSEFDPTTAWQIDINTWSGAERSIQVLIDDIGFDSRPVRSHKLWVKLPEERGAKPLAADAIEVAATVDLDAEGTPISPYIYGAAMGKRDLAAEMGITILRAGGNPISPHDWKTGFSSKGSDWYFENDGTESTPDKDWMTTFFGANKKASLESYLSIPMMGRVAKDGTSVGFDTTKYPDQESWAGKVQPADKHPTAGNGKRVKGTDAKGKPIIEFVESDPNDASKEVSPQEQADMLKYIVNDLGAGKADAGGVKFVALDNEPGLWHVTHRGMHPAGCSYDELWDRTKNVATLLKQIDPTVKIAGPTAWGWTEFFYSGLDSQQCDSGKASWTAPPDYTAHGKTPLLKWYMQQLNAHEKATGQKLVDILDVHFYPQNNIYEGGKPNDPATMEKRVQETRVMWDPTWKDPSWMGRETDKVIRLIPLLHDWINEANPGMQLALGEYAFGGEKDVSGGIAQIELLGVFAREKLDLAFYWFFPAPNSPQYFAYKLFRNPDGKHTAFGEKYLPVSGDHGEDVSIHAAKDSTTGRISFILVNKRVAKDAKVKLTFKRDVKAQDCIAYEFSGVDRFCIGQLPPQHVEGREVTVELPAMSAKRFDVMP